jgi:hypothetical protein
MKLRIRVRVCERVSACERVRETDRLLGTILHNKSEKERERERERKRESDRVLFSFLKHRRGGYTGTVSDFPQHGEKCACVCGVYVCVCVLCLYTSIDRALSCFLIFPSSPSTSTALLLPRFLSFFRLLDRCLPSLTQEVPAVRGPDEVPAGLGEGNSSPSAMLATFLEVI